MYSTRLSTFLIPRPLMRASIARNSSSGSSVIRSSPSYDIRFTLYFLESSYISGRYSSGSFISWIISPVLHEISLPPLNDRIYPSFFSSSSSFAKALIPCTGLPDAITIFTPFAAAADTALLVLSVICFLEFVRVPSISSASTLYAITPPTYMYCIMKSCLSPSTDTYSTL